MEKNKQVKTSHKLQLNLCLLSIVFFLVLSISLGYQNVQLNRKLKSKSIENISTQITRKPVEYRRLDTNFSNWSSEVKSSFNRKSTEYSFSYPSSLTMKPSVNGFNNTYDFFASEKDYQNYLACHHNPDPNANWEGACNFNNLLFTLSVSGDIDSIFEFADVSNLDYVTNGSNQS